MPKYTSIEAQLSTYLDSAEMFCVAIRRRQQRKLIMCRLLEPRPGTITQAQKGITLAAKASQGFWFTADMSRDSHQSPTILFVWLKQNKTEPVIINFTFSQNLGEILQF